MYVHAYMYIYMYIRKHMHVQTKTNKQSYEHMSPYVYVYVYMQEHPTEMSECLAHAHMRAYICGWSTVCLFGFWLLLGRN